MIILRNMYINSFSAIDAPVEFKAISFPKKAVADLKEEERDLFLYNAYNDAFGNLNSLAILARALGFYEKDDRFDKEYF